MRKSRRLARDGSAGVQSDTHVTLHGAKVSIPKRCGELQVPDPREGAPLQTTSKMGKMVKQHPHIWPYHFSILCAAFAMKAARVFVNATMISMEVVSKSLEDTERAAKKFVSQLEKGNQALVFGLRGELGSGKTTFVKGVAMALGVLETVTSPTFVIEKIYKLDSQDFEHLIHVDAYRLESGKELTTLGFDDVLKDPNNLVMIEWAERVSDVLPEDTKPIIFTVLDEHSRRIEIPYE